MRPGCDAQLATPGAVWFCTLDFAHVAHVAEDTDGVVQAAWSDADAGAWSPGRERTPLGRGAPLPPGPQHAAQAVVG